MQSIIGHLNDHHDRHAVVIGGGFIGLEMADQLAERGLRVTILEKAPHIMPLLSSDLANHLQLHLRSRNVTIVTSDGVVGFEEVNREGDASEKSLLVLTEQGLKLSADVVIFSIGKEHLQKKFDVISMLQSLSPSLSHAHEHTYIHTHIHTHTHTDTHPHPHSHIHVLELLFSCC